MSIKLRYMLKKIIAEEISKLNESSGKIEVGSYVYWKEKSITKSITRTGVVEKIVNDIATIKVSNTRASNHHEEVNIKDLMLTNDKFEWQEKLTDKIISDLFKCFSSTESELKRFRSIIVKIFTDNYSGSPAMKWIDPSTGTYTTGKEHELLSNLITAFDDIDEIMKPLIKRLEEFKVKIR